MRPAAASFVRGLTLLVIALMVITACEPSAPGGRKGGDTPRPGGRIVVGSSSDVKTLQPVLSSDTASALVHDRIYIGLTRLNPDNGEVEGGLAEKFALSSDGLTLTYTLRDGLVWSDGAPFTGEDYQYTSEAVMRSKKTVRKSTFDNVVGAKEYADGKADTITGITVGDNGKTVTIKFTQVYCTAILDMGGAGAGGIIPKHHFSKYWNNKTTDTSTNIDDNPLNMNPPAAMGPFVFKEYRPGDRAVLVRNDKYYRGAPLADEFVVKIYADSTAIKAALVVGEVTFAGIDAKDWDELTRLDHLKGFRFGAFSNTYMGLNSSNPKVPWLADKRVRQALTWGLDVDQIIQKVLFGFGTRVYAMSIPLHWSYDETDLTKYKYDPAKAKQLIESAGAKMGPDGFYRWTDGRTLTMTIETNSGNFTRETILQVAQEQYGKIGIKVQPLLESFPALTERTRYGKPDWEAFVLGFSLGVDPDPYDIWHSTQAHATGFNRVGWNKTDKLLEQQRSGPDCSVATRKKIIHEVDKQLNDEAPWVFLFTADALVFGNKALQAWEPKPFSTSSYWNVEKWWFRQ